MSLYATVTGLDDRTMTSEPTLSVTRVINPCAVIAVDDACLVTDPFFTSLRRLPMNEPIGMRPDQLRRVAGVLGGHGAFDHWRPEDLRGMAPSDVPVLVPHRRMRRRALRAGFTDVRETSDGGRARITPTVTVTTVAGDRVMGAWTNHYLVSGEAGSVYVGTEAYSLAPMQRVGSTQTVDVAVLPIDGLTFAGRQLVMDATMAIEAALVLGARYLVPIHYSQRRVRPVIRIRSGIDELLSLAAGRIEIRHAAAGVPIHLDVGAT